MISFNSIIFFVKIIDKFLIFWVKFQKNIICKSLGKFEKHKTIKKKKILGKIKNFFKGYFVWIMIEINIYHLKYYGISKKNVPRKIQITNN